MHAGAVCSSCLSRASCSLALAPDDLPMRSTESDGIRSDDLVRSYLLDVFDFLKRRGNHASAVRDILADKTNL